jgi:hypothetical protein
VADLGEAMTSEELTAWAAYEAVYGPVLVSDHVNLAGALVGLMVARLGGNKRARLKDFLPRWDSEAELAEGWAALERMAAQNTAGGDG